MGSRFWSVVAGILLGVLVMAPGVGAEAQPVAYVGLKYSLVRQGLDKDFVFQDLRRSPEPIPAGRGQEDRLPGQGIPGYLQEIHDPGDWRPRGGPTWRRTGPP